MTNKNSAGLRLAVSAAAMLALPFTRVLTAPGAFYAALPVMLALTAQIFAGGGFYGQAFESLKTGDIDTATAVALASGGALALGAYGVFFAPEAAFSRELLYCAAILPLTALSGRSLEFRAAKRAGRAADELVKGAPSPAGEALVRAIAPGDIITVRPGEAIPADGEVVEGFSGVDESALTGMASVVDKQPGSRVMLGSANISGTLEVRVESTGHDTVLAEKLHMLTEARNGNPAFIKAAELASRLFAAASIFAAVSVFAVRWIAGEGAYLALARAVFTLAAACPCALGFAVRLTAVTGVVKAALSGVIITRRARPKHLRGIGAVALEEAGAVTAGRPEVTGITALPGFFEEEIVTFAAAAANASGSPAAAAIREYSRPRVITGGLEETIVRAGNGEASFLRDVSRGFVGSALPRAEGFKEVPGGGFRAAVGGRDTIVGTRRLLREYGVKDRELARFSAGEICGAAVFVAINGRAAGVISMRDDLREGVAEAVKSLERMGVAVYMLSRGETGASERLAGRAGIVRAAASLDEIKAGSKEIAAVRGGNGGGCKLAVSGAAVISAGPGPAVKNADIALLKSDMTALPEAVGIINSTSRGVASILIVTLALHAGVAVFAALGIFSPFVPILSAALTAGASLISSPRYTGAVL